MIQISLETRKQQSAPTLEQFLIDVRRLGLSYDQARGVVSPISTHLWSSWIGCLDAGRPFVADGDSLWRMNAFSAIFAKMSKRVTDLETCRHWFCTPGWGPVTGKHAPLDLCCGDIEDFILFRERFDAWDESPLLGKVRIERLSV